MIWLLLMCKVTIFICYSNKRKAVFIMEKGKWKVDNDIVYHFQFSMFPFHLNNLLFLHTIIQRSTRRQQHQQYRHISNGVCHLNAGRIEVKLYCFCASRNG